MATLKSFEDIQAWRKARELSQLIFEQSTNGALSKDYSLKDQINRAAGSIMDNIAEGFERGGNKEFIQYLSYAKGSAGEVRSQLYWAFDRKYFSEKDHQELLNSVLEISKMISSLMSYLKKSELKGSKYTQEPETFYEIS